MTEISTCFHCKPRHRLLLDKTSVGKLQKWGDDKISPTILLKSQDGLLWKYLLTIQWRLIFLETSKQNEKYLNWGCQSQKLTDYFDSPFIPTVCYNWVSVPTAICRKTKHRQMALCLYFPIEHLWPKSFCFCTPPKLLSLRMFWGRLRNRSQAVSHSWAIYPKLKF